MSADRTTECDQVPNNPTDGARFTCSRCGDAAEFVVLDDGLPGEWVQVGPPGGEAAATVEAWADEWDVRPLIQRRLAQAWDEGFMYAAGQDHPAYPRTRRIDNPYEPTSSPGDPS